MKKTKNARAKKYRVRERDKKTHTEKERPYFISMSIYVNNNEPTHTFRAQKLHSQKNDCKKEEKKTADWKQSYGGSIQSKCSHV